MIFPVSLSTCNPVTLGEKKIREIFQNALAVEAFVVFVALTLDGDASGALTAPAT